MQRTYSARKQEYFERLTGLFSNYAKCLMVTADNVGSFQMQQVRMALRGEAVVCFGKNTMMRRVLKSFLEQNPGHDYKKIMSSINGNTGLVFTNCPDLGKIKQIIVENVVPAPARAGAVAPVDVIVPPGPIISSSGWGAITSIFLASGLSITVGSSLWEKGSDFITSAIRRMSGTLWISLSINL